MSTKNVIANPYEGLTPEQALETMRQLVTDETRNHIRMGLLYNYLVDSKLLDGTDVASPMDYICDNIQEVSRTALLVYGAVARAFNPEVCEQYGVTRLRALLTYKDAAKIELDCDNPGSTFILVPDKQGEVKPKLFSDCSSEDLRQAMQRLRETTPTKPIDSADRALVDRYRKAVTDAFPRGSPVRVQIRNHKGKAVVDFRGIPVAQVDKLIEALMGQMLTVPAPSAPQAQASQVS